VSKVDMNYSDRYRLRKRELGLCSVCGTQPIWRPKSPFCTSCKDKHNFDAKCYYVKNRSTRLASIKSYAVKNKKMALDAYGSNCSCCGEDTIEFLTIDHIEGYKKWVGNPRGGKDLYRWLRHHNFPPGFDVLCMNCNFAKGHFGYCPHKNVKSIDTPPASIQSGC